MKRWVVLGMVGLVVVAGMLTGLQRRLIYLPGQTVRPLPGWVEEVHTTTADDLPLRGWVARDSAEDPLLILFHGNGGTAADRLPLAEALRPHGIAVLLAEYRGYGGNPGRPTEEGLSRDATAWRAWADAHHDGPLAYVGESLGAAVATRLATTAPPRALVLRSPFTSLSDVGALHYPFLPLLRWALLDRYEVTEQIGQIDVPVLVIAGGDDTIVPPEQSRAVHDAATGPKRLVEVPGAGHNDRALLEGEEMITAIVDLIDPAGG